MAYRDDAHSLRAYRDRVSTELEEARRACREAKERAQHIGKLEEDLAAVDAKLATFEKSGWRSALSLEDVRIASPCSASWDEMKGDERSRFCGKCQKNVYNLSAMPREEAEAFLADRLGSGCVRLYKRTDGAVLTEDCPVGVKRRRRVRLAVVAAGGAMAVAAAATEIMTSQPIVAMGTVDDPLWESSADAGVAHVVPSMGVVAWPVRSTSEPTAPVVPTSSEHTFKMGKPVFERQ